jgi:hypothetical protein
VPEQRQSEDGRADGDRGAEGSGQLHRLAERVVGRFDQLDGQAGRDLLAGGYRGA